MTNIHIKIRTDARVATAVALVPVPRMRHGVMHLGIFTADPQTDRGQRHA